MAATRFISMHKSKGKTPAVSLSERVAYILNPTKTDGGRLVSAHGCDPATAAAEMLLTRRQYLDAGGWVPGNDKEVLAYHIRQAFKPGEITPEDANRIGRELAERFTKTALISFFINSRPPCMSSQGCPFSGRPFCRSPPISEGRRHSSGSFSRWRQGSGSFPR